MITLNHAASSSYRGSAYKSGLGSGLRDAISEYETHSFFNAKLSGGNAAILQSQRHALVRALIFLPDAHVGLATIWRFSDLLPCPPFFKCRTDIERRAFHRQHHGEQPLAAPPAYAGEIVQRGALHQEDGVEVIRLHQLSGLFLPLGSLLPRDGLGLVAH